MEPTGRIEIHGENQQRLARLIAAAPAMLTALREANYALISAQSIDGNLNDIQAVQETVRAAIAAAEGEPDDLHDSPL